MSLNEYLFRASGQIMRLFYRIDSYVPVFSLIQNVIQGVTAPLSDKCKKISNYSSSNNSPVDNHTISVVQVYFKNTSPKRKEGTKKQLIFGIDDNNINNAYNRKEIES